MLIEKSGGGQNNNTFIVSLAGIFLVTHAG